MNLNKIKRFINNTKDFTNKFNKEEIEIGKLFSIFSYFSFISIIVYFCINNEFSKFHAKQGINLFLFETILLIVKKLSFGYVMINIFIEILNIVIILLCILGIYYSIIGKAKKLPFIDKYSIIK